MTKKPPGRPRKPASQRHTERWATKLTPDQARNARRVVEKTTASQADWLRDLIVAASEAP